MSLTEEERKRAVELGKTLGVEVTFDNEESGMFIGDKKVSAFEDLFPELKTE
ncbi:hypothetical protein [Brevibacillus sp. NRS-1366]|uniref:hypothetical protein n=1 Tax=Brevibacillus sp. NRS-1366 TaxID=3233899 RepID=UPI003D1EE40E